MDKTSKVKVKVEDLVLVFGKQKKQALHLLNEEGYFSENGLYYWD